MSRHLRPVILLATGSFNPITNMHLRMFELARDRLRDDGYQVLGGVISPVNDGYKVHKPTLISSSHRLSMVNLAIQDYSFVRVSKFEIKQQDWSRTRPVLEHHQDLISNFCNGLAKQPTWLPGGIQPSADGDSNLRIPQIIYLCGADLLESFAVPGLWQDVDIEAIVKNFGLVVIARGNSNAERFIEESDILLKHRANIRIVSDAVVNTISSTAVRQLVSQGRSVKFLLPDKAIEYIEKNQLYREN